ncbi:MAG: peptidyl-tRNA hydrolase [Thermoplasmata archaeon]|nr:MAG: peptidyl-tRNA hydrolase [Thermoplasmata archaeon]
MYKMVILTNDIPMSPGKLAAQVAHAAVECALKAAQKNPRIFQKWMEEGQKKVVLKADEEEIFKIQREARSKKICTSLIKDAGMTELEPGTLTALAIGPAEEEKIDAITAHLPLR